MNKADLGIALMRIFLVGFCALAFALPLHGVAAQVLSESMANDQELYAAYCAGALTARAQRNSKIDLEQLAKDARKLGWPAPSDHSHAFERVLSRFRTYLIARGFMSPGARTLEAQNGAKIAAAHGKADEQQCSDFATQCKPSCDPRIGGESITSTDCFLMCYRRATESQVCKTIDRCLEKDSLPF